MLGARPLRGFRCNASGVPEPIANAVQRPARAVARNSVATIAEAAAPAAAASTSGLPDGLPVGLAVAGGVALAAMGLKHVSDRHWRRRAGAHRCSAHRMSRRAGPRRRGAPNPLLLVRTTSLYPSQIYDTPSRTYDGNVGDEVRPGVGAPLFLRRPAPPHAPAACVSPGGRGTRPGGRRAKRRAQCACVCLACVPGVRAR